MRIGSLFSGAGGLDMAVEQVFGAHTVWHCENDAAASKVLAARWLGVPNLSDITCVDWAHAYATELYHSWLTSGSIHGLARKPLRAWMGPLHTEIHRRLPTLHGHDLACWCPPTLTCHADILLELANQEAE